MTDDFGTLYAFNRWANAKMLGACRQLSVEQYSAEPGPGWTPVRPTVAHIAIVTEAWLRSLAGGPDDTYLTAEEMPSVDDAERLLAVGYGHFETVRPKFTADWLGTPLTLRRRGRTAVLPPWVVLRHVVNHTKYLWWQVASKCKRIGR